MVNLSKISLTVPTVSPGGSNVVTGATPTGPTTASGGATSFSCAAPTGRIAGRSLGPVSLRVGYASAGLTRGHSARQRRTLGGRMVLALTANAHFAAHGIRHGTRLAVARRRLHLTRYRVGLNDWYTAPDGRVRAVLKVRRGTVREVGIANPSLTNSRRATARFRRSFPFRS